MQRVMALRWRLSSYMGVASNTATAAHRAPSEAFTLKDNVWTALPYH